MAHNLADIIMTITIITIMKAIMIAMIPIIPLWVWSVSSNINWIKEISLNQYQYDNRQSLSCTTSLSMITFIFHKEPLAHMHALLRQDHKIDYPKKERVKQETLWSYTTDDHMPITWPVRCQLTGVHVYDSSSGPVIITFTVYSHNTEPIHP